MCVKQSHLAIDERSLMQGARRAMSGDGHSTTIAFVAKVIEEVQDIANHAFSALTAETDERKPDLFDETPRQMLHELSCACTSSKKASIACAKPRTPILSRLAWSWRTLIRNLMPLSTMLVSFLTAE